MLKHEQEEHVDAARVAVTPQELAEAIAAVESKQEALAQSDRVTIGEAVSHLGLTITPDELLSEILRKKELAAEQAQRAKTIRQNRKRKLLNTIFAGSLALNLFLLVRPAAAPSDLSIQQGTFQSYSQQEGEVQFAHPFRRPPNVEFPTVDAITTKVQPFNVSTRGFHWRNTGPNDIFNNTSVHWYARGDPE